MFGVLTTIGRDLEAEMPGRKVYIVIRMTTSISSEAL